MKRTRGLLSVILPAYNEQDMVPIAYEAVSKILDSNEIPFEIVFVNDGSTDNTYDEIVHLSQKYTGRVRGVSFSRNFGKESAILAGLSEAQGDCCVVMDCDLQHPAETIPQMYNLWLEGFDVVEGVKSNRGNESAIHRGLAKMFYALISRLSNMDMRDASDFKLLDRVAVNTIIDMPERAPFFRGMSQWIGYESTKVYYEVAERQMGESKWSARSLIKYAIHNISTFSAKPMTLVMWLGVIFLIGGMATAIEALIRHFNGTSEAGFTTVICLIFISCGFIMLSLGIIGYYIAQIYEEIKARPRYIVSHRCGSGRRKEQPGTENTQCTR